MSKVQAPTCKTCRRTSTLADNFNQVVCIDLKEHIHNKVWILHLIDAATRYSAACLIRTTHPDEINRRVYLIWIKYRALLNWQKDKSNCALKRKYQDLRNQARKELRIAETSYWKDQFKKANTKKDFWKLSNKVKRKQKDCRIGPLKDSQGNLITDDKQKAGIMNSYLTQSVNHLQSIWNQIPT